MYVRMYVCIVRTHVCMYVCTYVRMYVRMYLRMYVCTYVLTHVCTYVRTYIRVCVYVCMYVRTYVRVCICSNRPSLSENVNSTPGILRVVVTGNFNVYRPDTLRMIFIFGFIYSITIFNFPLFVLSQLHILNCERQCKKFHYQHYTQCDCLSFTVTLPPRLTFQTSLPSHPLGHVLSPNSRVALRPP